MLGKACTPPLAEWSPEPSGLSKLELCQFYNVQQFPERDVPHDKSQDKDKPQEKSQEKIQEKVSY